MRLLPNLWGSTFRFIQIGELRHDSNTIELVLNKFCKKLFVETGDKQFPYQFLGSGTAIRYVGRHFIFCCRHQISGCILSQISFPLSYDEKTIFPNMISLASEDHPAEDVVVCEYLVDTFPLPNLTSEFFPVDDEYVWPRWHVQLPFMLFGYPTEDQLVDYVDEQRIAAHSVCVPGKLLGQMPHSGLFQVKIERDRAFNTDGMSGGPVFYVGQRAGSFFAGFAGMMARGSAVSDHLSFIAADTMLNLIGQLPAKAHSL